MCFVLWATCYVLCAMCYVLYAVCCVLCAVAVCCMLCFIFCLGFVMVWGVDVFRCYCADYFDDDLS